MIEIAAIAFTTFFATIGPVDLAALLAVLTPDSTSSQRRAIRMAILKSDGVLSRSGGP